jgi:hypothetical protein
MKRQVPGLAETARGSRPEIPDSIFIVRVDGAQFPWQAQQPFYVQTPVSIPSQQFSDCSFLLGRHAR